MQKAVMVPVSNGPQGEWFPFFLANRIAGFASLWMQNKDEMCSARQDSLTEKKKKKMEKTGTGCLATKYSTAGVHRWRGGGETLIGGHLSRWGRGIAKPEPWSAPTQLWAFFRGSEAKKKKKKRKDQLRKCFFFIPVLVVTLHCDNSTDHSI